MRLFGGKHGDRVLFGYKLSGNLSQTLPVAARVEAIILFTPRLQQA